jgi:hypothetical protein
MRKKLENVLRTHNLLDLFERNARVGDARFQVRFPFVRFESNRHLPVKAIKALNLDKEEPTDIFRHADAWLANVRRLRQYKTAPSQLLFVLRKPKSRSNQHLDAYERILSDFEKDDIRISDDHDELNTLKFSRS